MSDIKGFDLEPMMDMYLFETKQLLEQLENLVLDIESSGTMSKASIDEIFRVMHTLKGSAAMMMVSSIRNVAHAVENVFAIIRSNPNKDYDIRVLSDIILDSTDLMRDVIIMMESGNKSEIEYEDLSSRIRDVEAAISEGKSIQANSEKKSKKQKFYITSQKEYSSNAKTYKCEIKFEEGCEMENVRAFSIVHSLTDVALELFHRPSNLIEDPNSSFEIVRDGFDLYLLSEISQEQIKEIIEESLFVDSFNIKVNYDYSEEIKDLIEEKIIEDVNDNSEMTKSQGTPDQPQSSKSTNLITVSLDKLDILMNLVGEIVITESMVTQNPDLADLELDNFNKSARQLRKLTDELQDIVMDIRMVPVAGLFQKMKRIVRDMSKSLDKEVEFLTLGEETEIDKSILDMLSDPMMHLIRNAMDHGIETLTDRSEKGKDGKGTLMLSARNMGSDVVITIKDDGKGIDRSSVLDKAVEQGILSKPAEEMSEKEINALILHPGFSTKESVTEYSGRGVGMDVVKKNLEQIGGSIGIESELGMGTTIEMKIPLTLAIIDGMEVSVGKSRYTIPTTSIKESFRPEERNIVIDPQGNEMLMVRGDCFPVVRMHRFFKTKAAIQELTEGIVVMVENEESEFCLFADELIGEQQVVVKPLPSYIYKFIGELRGISGCTIMGNGEMSLIVDVAGF